MYRALTTLIKELAYVGIFLLPLSVLADGHGHQHGSVQAVNPQWVSRQFQVQNSPYTSGKYAVQSYDKHRDRDDHQHYRYRNYYYNNYYPQPYPVYPTPYYNNYYYPQPYPVYYNAYPYYDNNYYNSGPGLGGGIYIQFGG